MVFVLETIFIEMSAKRYIDTRHIRNHLVPLIQLISGNMYVPETGILAPLHVILDYERILCATNVVSRP